MKILFLDPFGDALDLALRSQDCGHQVMMALGSDHHYQTIGKGLLPRTFNFRDHLRWADFVFLADNTKYLKQLDAFRRNYPQTVVFGPSEETASWETNRLLGMKILKDHGVPVPPYKQCSSYEEAVAYVKKRDTRLVCKPCGDADKALSYCSKSPEDLLFMLKEWRSNGQLKDQFILQDFIPGIEFAVSAWVGPFGFAGGWFENFEHKKLMAGECGPACYDDQTEVLTRLGWKFWEDVVEDDELGTLIVDEFTFEKPSRLVAAPFDGDLVTWKTKHVDIAVTPGHNMYVQDDHCRNPFHFEPAAVTATRPRKIMKSGGKWVGALCGVTPDKARLIGAHIADGYVNKGSVRFGNCPLHKQTAFVKFAKSAGYPAIMYGADLYINSTELADELRPLGLAHEKYIPQAIKDSPVEVLEAFLEGYLAGDGSFCGISRQCETVSRRLADDLQEIALKIGLAASIWVRDRVPAHDINGVRAKAYQRVYAVGFSTRVSKAELRPADMVARPYTGMVYCATVSSHILVTRRNGKVCYNGNTGEMGTTILVTDKSKLAREVLKPLEPALLAAGYNGCIDVNCIIDEKGKPWPLEFTNRPGYPALSIETPLYPEDPIQWMYDLATTGEEPKFLKNMCSLGVVMALPPFPYPSAPADIARGMPIFGMTPSNKKYLHAFQVQKSTVPGAEWMTAAAYAVVVTGVSEKVSGARENAYRRLKQLNIPGSPMYRNDIGAGQAGQIPKLQAMGYATAWKY